MKIANIRTPETRTEAARTGARRRTTSPLVIIPEGFADSLDRNRTAGTLKLLLDPVRDGRVRGIVRSVVLGAADQRCLG